VRELADRQVVEALVLVVHSEVVMRRGVVRVRCGHARERFDGCIDVAEPLVQHTDVVEGDDVTGVGRDDAIEQL